MPFIETVDDFVEFLADAGNVYGGHDEDKDPDYKDDDCNCRVCWTGRMEQRIKGILTNELRLNHAEWEDKLKEVQK